MDEGLHNDMRGILGNETITEVFHEIDEVHKWPI